MATVEWNREYQATPRELQAALDTRVDTGGIEQAGFVSVELLPPSGDSVLPIEERYFHVASRQGIGEKAAYSWLMVVPGGGVTQTTLSFTDEHAFFTRRTQVLGLLGGTDGEERPLPETKLKKIYREVTDPTLEPRQETIRRFYEERHAQRSFTGRAIATLLRTDRPKYL